MNINIYAKHVKIPNNINQDMQEKKIECKHGLLFEYLQCSDLGNKAKVTKI